MAEKFQGQVALKALILKDGKALLMKNVHDGKWQMPGGRMHTGERPGEAIVRECKEELGVTVRVSGVHSVDTFTNPKFGEHFLVTFICELEDESAELTLDKDEVAEVSWVGANELDSIDIWPEYRTVLHDVLT